MSAWRRKAIEALPEHRDEIERAWSPMALWIELHMRFEQAFEAGDMDHVRRTMKYARYCLDARDRRVFTAVVLAFVQHLPVNASIRAALPELMSAEEVQGLRVVLAYFVGDRVVSGIREACLAREKAR